MIHSSMYRSEYIREFMLVCNECHNGRIFRYYAAGHAPVDPSYYFVDPSYYFCPECVMASDEDDNAIFE